MIAIIDYGAGNLSSVEKAIKYLDADCEKVLIVRHDFDKDCDEAYKLSFSERKAKRKGNKR